MSKQLMKNFTFTKFDNEKYSYQGIEIASGLKFQGTISKQEDKSTPWSMEIEIGKEGDTYWDYGTGSETSKFEAFADITRYFSYRVNNIIKHSSNILS